MKELFPSSGGLGVACRKEFRPRHCASCTCYCGSTCAGSAVRSLKASPSRSWQAFEALPAPVFLGAVGECGGGEPGPHSAPEIGLTSVKAQTTLNWKFNGRHQSPAIGAYVSKRQG
ncbi:hypothetical protein V8F06_006944 [Rhypophila decipiens]